MVMPLFLMGGSGYLPVSAGPAAPPPPPLDSRRRHHRIWQRRRRRRRRTRPGRLKCPTAAAPQSTLQWLPAGLCRSGCRRRRRARCGPVGSEALCGPHVSYCALAANPRPATPSTVSQPSAGPQTTELHNFGVNHFLRESAVPVYQARTCEQGTVGTRP